MTGIFTDPRWVQFPVIPGHEWSGTVVEVGSRRRVGPRRRPRRLRRDDRAATAAARAAAARRTGANGSRRSGSPVRAATPNWSRCRRGSCTGCPTTSRSTPACWSSPRRSCSTVSRRRGRSPARPVGVIGVGTLGSLAIALLRLHSPARLVAYGIREEELELARQLGATEVVLTGDGGTATAAELDLVVDTAGVPVGDRARHRALPPRRPRGPARHRRRGPVADVAVRPAGRQGHGVDRKPRLSGRGLVARGRAGLRPRARARPDRHPSLPGRPSSRKRCG